MLVYRTCECFVMHMLYVCVLSASCDSSQCCVLHDLQFVNTSRGCKRRPYRRSIVQSVLTLDFNFERAVEGSILTAGKG